MSVHNAAVAMPTVEGEGRPPSPSRKANELRHMPQLDSLRTFAVLVVMVYHFWPEATFGLPFGIIGVQLFFVLSGFLITGILLGIRDQVESNGRSAWMNIRQFYIRRFLRIFPLFYMALALAWLIGLPDARNDLVWHATYMSNFYFARLGYFTENFAHFWSLAVEEHFYLVWPFVVIFTPRRHLLPTLVTIAAVAPVYRTIGALVGVYSSTSWMWLLTPPFANIDSLALGGILAYASAPGVEGLNRRTLGTRLTTVGLWIGVPLAISLCALSFFKLSAGDGRVGVENTIWALVFVWLTDRAARGFGGVTGSILQMSFIRYLGKISYGLYVFHPFMTDLLPRGFARIGLPYPATHPLQFPLLVFATIAVAVCSWHLYERPLNDLKRYFRYA